MMSVDFIAFTEAYETYYNITHFRPLVQEKLELEAACVDKIRRTKADVSIV